MMNTVTADGSLLKVTVMVSGILASSMTRVVLLCANQFALLPELHPAVAWPCTQQTNSSTDCLLNIICTVQQSLNNAAGNNLSTCSCSVPAFFNGIILNACSFLENASIRPELQTFLLVSYAACSTSSRSCQAIPAVQSSWTSYLPPHCCLTVPTSSAVLLLLPP